MLDEETMSISTISVDVCDVREFMRSQKDRKLRKVLHDLILELFG